MSIVLATGGTGGHIHPALQVAEELRRMGHQVVFVGSLSSAEEKIKKRGFEVKSFKAFGLSGRKISVVIKFFGSMFTSGWKSFCYLKEKRPSAVLGFGGYGAFPVVMAAKILGIPAMIHEQNVVPGRANKLLAGVVKRVAVSFEQSKKHFPANKVVWTGCPTHLVKKDLDRTALLQKFQLKAGPFTILITGGSQGSHHINEIFFASVVDLKDKLDFQVIHLTGAKDFEELNKNYKSLKVAAAVYPFLEEMEQAYSLADMVISRAGALTITEIALFDLPAVLIPYPHAQGHQMDNALVLAEAQLARIIEEKNLSKEKLVEEILKIKDYRKKRDENVSKSPSFVIENAAVKIAQEVVEL